MNHQLELILKNRRIMWKNINELSLYENGYNMRLSTYSMEESEILCDTISWLKDANFICIVILKN